MAEKIVLDLIGDESKVRNEKIKKLLNGTYLSVRVLGREVYSEGNLVNRHLGRAYQVLADKYGEELYTACKKVFVEDRNSRSTLKPSILPKEEFEKAKLRSDGKKHLDFKAEGETYDVVIESGRWSSTKEKSPEVFTIHGVPFVINRQQNHNDNWKQLLKLNRYLDLKPDDIVITFDTEGTSDGEEGNPVSLSEPDIAEQMKNLIDNERYQIILTGAPGTGKTFSAKKVARTYMHCTNEQENGLYQLYSTADESGLTPQQVWALKEGMTRLLNETSCFSGPLRESGARLFPADLIRAVCEQVKEKIPDYTEDSFWADADELRGRMVFVQFHPSYDYTDFVEGLRPVEIGNKMHFKRMDGSFMSFCRYVAWRNESCLAAASGEQRESLPLYFFLIDEINRADLSKVLGELMFCLEGDKRGKHNRVKTQFSNLDTYFPNREDLDPFYRDCFQDGFYIPENVVVIGTMNDIDRSVESMDFALRRRFVWMEVKVTEDLLREAFYSKGFFDKLGLAPQVLETVRPRLIENIMGFNALIHKPPFRLTPDFDISQGQFTDIPASAIEEDEDGEKSGEKLVTAILKWVWDYRVHSLMKEYLRGRPEAEKLLESELKDAWLGKRQTPDGSAAQ